MRSDSTEDIQQFARMMAKLATIFPREIDQLLIDTYFEILKCYSWKVISRALAMMAEQRLVRYFPTAAEISEWCGKATKSEQLLLPEPAETPEEQKKRFLTAKYWLQYYGWNKPQPTGDPQVDDAEPLRLTGLLTPEGGEQFVRDNWNNQELLEQQPENIQTTLLKMCKPREFPDSETTKE